MANREDAEYSRRTKNASPYLDTEQAALYLKISTRLLKRLRRRGDGPVFRMHSRYIQYHIDELDAWSEANSRREIER
ncbi:helix-turn-helix domain-containing protein [Novosphingobium gossypii]|uniref:helix-turn-helix domain-containing protein n=1 Tax=Novosphingobium gossypii TaxID=1604774 RepID=UPI003D1EA8FF